MTYPSNSYVSFGSAKLNTWPSSFSLSTPGSGLAPLPASGLVEFVKTCRVPICEFIPLLDNEAAPSQHNAQKVQALWNLLVAKKSVSFNGSCDCTISCN